jgi:hypothetical protein
LEKFAEGLFADCLRQIVPLTIRYRVQTYVAKIKTIHSIHASHQVGHDLSLGLGRQTALVKYTAALHVSVLAEERP